MEDSKVRKSRYVGTSSTTQVAKILVKHWRSSGSSRTTILRTSTCWLLVGKTVRGSSFGTWMGKVPNWECLFVHRKQGLFLSVYVDDIRMAGRTQNMAHRVEEIVETCGSWRTNIFLDHEDVWYTQRECKPNEIIIKEHKETLDHEFLQQQMKISSVGETSRKNGRVVRRHGRTCAKMRWAITQSFKIPFGRRWFQKARLGNGWRTVQCVLSNCFEMLKLGTNWQTRHSLVCKQPCSSSHKMDKSVWPTFSKINFIHSSHKWLPTKLSCG